MQATEENTLLQQRLDWALDQLDRLRTPALETLVMVQLKMSIKEAGLVVALMTSPVLSRDDIMRSVWYGQQRHVSGPYNLVMKVRRKLKPYGITIERSGMGLWQLSQRAKAQIRQLLKAKLDG